MANDPVEDMLFEVPRGDGNQDAKAPAGRSKTFRHYDPTQSFLLPPSLDDWLPEDHTARFVAEVVDEVVDLSPICNSYVESVGAPPYDRSMMLKLLLYAYSVGVTSSREMERRCQVDVAFRWLSANEAPDYRSISRFRRRHLLALDDLFIQVLALCASSGLVSLGRVALDGTKLRASANRHKAMSYDRLGPRMDEIKKQVAAILAEAEAVDAAEDEEFGEDRRGDELPVELATREGRLAKMRAAKEAIEAEAREKAATKAATRVAEEGGDDAAIEHAAEMAAARATPSKRAQRSFTDPESRMMTTDAGFHYCYNAQTVVDEASQVVLATEVTNQAADVNELIHLIAVTEHNLDAADIDDSPEVVLADAGYCSKANLQWIADTESNVLVATGGIATAGAPATDASHNTVTCTGITGSIKFNPALTTNGGPSGSGTTSVKGSLTGCTTNGTFSIVSNKVKGVLTSTSTSTSARACTGLVGITQETGTLTVTWKASVKLLSKTSVITIHTAQGGADNTATHANFKIPGSPGGTASSVSGSFAGNDGGASSTTDANSVETLANPTDGHPAAFLG